MIHIIKHKYFKLIIDDVKKTIENPFVHPDVIGTGDLILRTKTFKVRSNNYLDFDGDHLYLIGNNSRKPHIISIEYSRTRQFDLLLKELKESCKEPKSHLPGWW